MVKVSFDDYTKNQCLEDFIEEDKEEDGEDENKDT